MGDRVVVITGASGKLGPDVARAFAAQGDRLALVARDEDPLEALLGDLPGGRGRHAAIVGDVSTAAGAAAVVAETHARLGPATVLLHLVGTYLGGTVLEEQSEVDWRTLLDDNLWTTFHTLRALLPDIRAARAGRIVTVSSPLAGSPVVHIAGYAATKAAVESVTLTVARELAAAGADATANVVLVRTIGDAKPTHTRPDEIAAALVWLCSPAAAAVNGQRIPLVGRGV